MNLNEKDIYVFNPDYVLRNDKCRVALYAKECVNIYSSIDWNNFIHPFQAKFLSFFTYNRTLGENIKLMSNYFGQDVGTISKWIYPFLENTHPLYVSWRNKRILFPKYILVKKEKLSNVVSFLNLTPELFDCDNIDLDTYRYYSGPLMITLMLNNKCVTCCKYCYADTQHIVLDYVPITRWIDIIEESYDMQIRQVNLMGGEVFMYNKWDVLLKKIVDLKMSPRYISTKIPFTKDLIDRLLKTGYKNRIQVSFDTSNISILKKVLGVDEKYLYQMKEGLYLLDKSGLKYHVATVLHSCNGLEDDLKELFGFLGSLSHISDWRISPVVNPVKSKMKNFDTMKLQRAEIERLFQYIESHLLPCSHFPILLNRAALDKYYYTCKNGSVGFQGPRCSALNTHLFVLPDGKATICEQLYWNPLFIVGDIMQSSLSEIWRSEKSLWLANLKRDDIQNASQCKVCALFESCFANRNRCWADIVKAFGTDNWDFPDPRCERSPVMINNLEYL